MSDVHTETVEQAIMLDLIARLEAAAEGSRELDTSIGRTYDLPPLSREVDGAPRSWPHYTTSIDAARSLSNWMLIYASDIGADGLAMVKLGNPSLSSPSLEVYGIHSDLIIAWCIAALKARETGQ